MAKKVPIKLDGEFKDIVICALRYAVTRNTYIVDTVCSWIESHPYILDHRVIVVMMKDVKAQLKYYEKVGTNSITVIDYDRLKAFYQWLQAIINDVND